MNTACRQELLTIGKAPLQDYPIHKPFYNFFKETLRTHKNLPAILDDDRIVTYEELNHQVNQMAYFLCQKGIKAEMRVGVYCKPSLEMIVTIIAILKLDACYVPLDISYPKDRLNHIIKDSEIAFVLFNHDEPLVEIIKKTKDIKLVDILEYSISGNNLEEFNDNNEYINAEFPAYLIYTSGSSGTPKGIQVSHRALNNHMLWMKETFNFDFKDKILFKTPITFDPSIWEILLAFYCGAILCIAPENSFRDPVKLIELVNHYQITTLQLVPIVLRQLLQNPIITTCTSLKRIFVGGESLQRQIKLAYFKKMSAQLINLYGPAEATIDITYHIVEPTFHNFNHDIIGKAITNNHLFVLDENESLCQIGEEGELCISGDNLAIGYFNRQELNLKKFKNNPYLKNQRMYKTGDIVRWLPDGCLEYVGRNDSQLKINGVRVEPHSIMTHILLDKDIKNCFILKETNKNGHAFLSAYLVPSDKKIINLKKIHQRLSIHFPSYILPKKYYVIKSEPLSPNGKLDIKFLEKEGILVKEEINLIYPKNDIEQKLQTIWKQILNLKQIGITENFFDLGGDSLLSIMLQEEIYKNFNINLNIEELINTNTISEQAKILKTKVKKHLSKKINDFKEYIIPLNNNTEKKINLFLIHPIGGTVFWFIPLARALEKVCQVYAIQDPEITNSSTKLDSIIEMAGFYAKEIKKIQSSGTYLLGGASFGATVAIEIANIFSRQSEKIADIFNFDGWAVYPHELKDKDFFSGLMKKQQEDWIAKFKAENYKIVTDKLFEIQWKRIKLLYKYQMQPFFHRMLLFKANKLMPYFMEIEDKHNQWGKYSKNLTTVNIPGDHETIFIECNANLIADEIIKRILFYSEKIEC